MSLALGAFIAGMVLSDSEYSHQILADILPFRDMFNSIFFISIGMLLSLTTLSANLTVVLAWTAALIAGKAIVAFLVVLLLGYTPRVSAMAALGLAQIGEFSFILAQAGQAHNLFSEPDYQRFLAAAILSIIATPFLIKAAPRVGFALQSLLPARSRLLPEESEAAAESALSDHVIIAGYGLNGRILSNVLRRAGTPHLVLELNGRAVRRARARRTYASGM